MNNDRPDNDAEKIDVLTKAIGDARSDEELTRLHIERGHCYERLEDAVKSTNDFLTALDTAQRKSDIVHIKSMIAYALAKKDQKDQAVFWALGAVDQDPCNAEGYHTLGLICDICGFLNIAIESLQRAVHLEPGRWDSIRVLGTCLRENGRIQEAIETLSRYVAGNPNEPLGLYNLAWSLHILGGRGNLQMAKDMYERALLNNPGRNMRAIIERKLNDLGGIAS